MRKFTHVHCRTANSWFSRSRQHVDDESSMRSSAQVASNTSGSSRRLFRRRCLRFLLTLWTSLQGGMIKSLEGIIE